MRGKIRAVIFDMDGVIFDTERVWRDAFLNANRRFEIELSESYRQSICGKSEDLIRYELKLCLPQLDVDAYREYTASYVKEKIEQGAFDVKTGFDVVMDYLKSKEYKIALATSSRRARASQMFCCKGYNMDLLFDACVYGDEVGMRSKPAPDIFLEAAKRIGIAPEFCAVAEDSVNGIQAANAGGFFSVMVVDLIEPDFYCLQNTKRIVRSLEELQAVLEDEK